MPLPVRKFKTNKQTKNGAVGNSPVNNRKEGKIFPPVSGEHVEKRCTFPSCKNERDADIFAEGFSSKAQCKQNIVNQPKAIRLFIIMRVCLVENR